jgi:hypothetical protein
MVIKSIRDSSPNKALSIRTTNSQSQSRETVPLNDNLLITAHILYSQPDFVPRETQLLVTKLKMG